MKAVRLHDVRDLRVEEVAAPSSPPPGHVNLAVRAAGICGSDLHNYRTGQWITRRPSVAGHEFCGRVTAIGEGVSGFAVGDVVVADSRFWCGNCPACAGGRHNVCENLGFVGEACDGGFADAVQLPARLLVPHAPSLPPRIAAMAEPLAVALHAVRRLAAPRGEPVLVVGCGTIGGLCALLLAHLHDGPILLSDPNSARADLVSVLSGGRRVGLVAEDIAAALGGRRLRHAIDATGHVGAIATTLGLLAGAGALCLVGIGHGKLDLDPTELVEREIALIGCHAFADDDLVQAASLLVELQGALEQLCEVLPGLDEVPAAYERLLAGQSTKLKTIVQLTDEPAALFPIA
ncbi:alcohol dehydrogenase catalytic domain-containing protein [Labrys sp. LIt4]|uniref:zinc-dependent alcohol dehydrogenase n=1 Tax=Labrys sp. LIt4 TaxID=2821355 RepID=UPI001AE02A48|nr:alcohol dehydrogenase catalytic domain-containing protein [Labrys sp. LIt4]MBP0580644.1 alcohol dehydrogenase catalytic domain-containing protein [Labrys sp. LIt4]